MGNDNLSSSRRISRSRIIVFLCNFESAKWYRSNEVIFNTSYTLCFDSEIESHSRNGGGGSSRERYIKTSYNNGSKIEDDTICLVLEVATGLRS
ncbi:MAG: hypothetical protein M3298_10505 [Thermoproteota archaeon]|nr:hypothetical protein [Thermoproteota archaeon]